MSMLVQKSHQITKGGRSFTDAKRLYLVDDLKMLKITMSNTSSRNKLNPEINDHYNILTGECQKDELKTKDKALYARLKERVHDLQLGVESYQQQVNLTAPTITFPGIEKYEMFYIVTDPVYGIIYENSKKEKKVMRHQEIHKFYDATLKRVLEGLKSYNNDVTYGYVTSSLSKEDVGYMQLFAEEIEEWLKHHDQIRRWEIYVNGRPLGSRRERPE
ncbi:hypothetical protein Tco_0936451 [Tanacetum coccineum]